MKEIHLKVLWALKPYLDINSEFVCVAARRSHYAGLITLEELTSFKDMITARIAPHNTVDGWLSQFKCGDMDDNTNEMLEYRHRWVDEMIKEFGV